MGHVYFLRGAAEGRVKIGQTGGTVEDRLRQHHVSNPELVPLEDIETDAPGKCETHIHAMLEHCRVPGTKDWFDLEFAEVPEVARRAREWCADDFVMQGEADRFSGRESDGTMLASDELAHELCQELRRLRSEEYALSVRRLRVENELRVLIGTADGIHGLVSFKSHSRRVFNGEEFRSSEFGYLWEEFKRPTVVRPFKLQ